MRVVFIGGASERQRAQGVPLAKVSGVLQVPANPSPISSGEAHFDG